MSDFEFVDPSTGAVLGTHAFGTVAAGTASASWAARLRYKYGLSGSGVYQAAVILEVSEDGGATYRTDLADFTIAVTAIVNTPADPLFLGTVLPASRTNRLELAPMRAGSAYDLAIDFSPTLKTGDATTDYTWRLGVIYNESVRQIDPNPDAPTGVLAGVGDVSVSEWVTAPTLALGTGEVTLGASAAVVTGLAVAHAGGAATLSQTASSGVLTSGQEYIALLSMSSAGAVVTTKGARATAGSAVQPAFPAGNLPIAVVRVPYGGVIATGTLVAVTGRCLVAASTGLTVTVQPGRAVMPGFYLTPGVVQTLTVPNNAMTRVYLSVQAVANTTAGVPLADVTTVAGAITAVVDARTILYQGMQPRLYATLDADGQTILDPVLSGALLSGTLDADGNTIQDPVLSGAALSGALNADGQRVTNLPVPVTATDGGDAVPLTYVRGLPVKSPVRCIGDPEVTWTDVVANGDFATVLTPWTGTNWAWDTGAALHTAGATDALTQDVTIVSGVRYKLTFSVGGAAGTVTASIGAVNGTPVAAGAGVTEQIIIAGASGTLALAFTPSSDFDGTLDDVFCTATLFGLPTLDGVALNEGDRALLPMQADVAECNKWIVSGTGPWTRHPDCASAYYLYAGAEVWCREGTTWAKSKWVQTANITDIDTSAPLWELAYQIP